MFLEYCQTIAALTTLSGRAYVQRHGRRWEE